MFCDFAPAFPLDSVSESCHRDVETDDGEIIQAGLDYSEI